MTQHDEPATQGDNDWPEPEVKRYPGFVIVLGILLATSLLWSGCALIGMKAVKYVDRPRAAAVQATRLASVGR